MNIAEISETMTGLEEQTVAAFGHLAKAFDIFNQGASRVVRALLAENNELRCEIAKLRGEDVIVPDEAPSEDQA